MISINSVTVRYQHILALDNFSSEFGDQQVYGIIGKNGAGKSTLLKVITGLITEYEGSVRFNTKILKEIKHELGYAPEDIFLLPYLTGREYLQLIARLRGVTQPEAQIDELLIHLGMKDVENTLSLEYSHGTKKKLSFAAALLGRPKYLILDESLNGFDPSALSYAKELIRSMAKKETYMLLASHDIEMISELCSVVMVLNEGRLIKTYKREEISELSGEFRRHVMHLVGNSHS